MAYDDERYDETLVDRPLNRERVVERPAPVVDQSPWRATPATGVPTRTIERVVDHPTTVHEVYAPVAVADQTVSRTGATFSVSQLLHGLCGFFLLLLGALAVGRAGFSGDAATHTVSVLGIQHTTVIGLFEIAAGLLLVAAALTPGGRPLGGMIGTVLIVAGVILAGANAQLLQDVHTSHGLGWIALVTGIVSLVAAFLPATTVLRRRAVTVR